MAILITNRGSFNLLMNLRKQDHTQCLRDILTNNTIKCPRPRCKSATSTCLLRITPSSCWRDGSIVLNTNLNCRLSSPSSYVPAAVLYPIFNKPSKHLDTNGVANKSLGNSNRLHLTVFVPNLTAP